MMKPALETGMVTLAIAGACAVLFYVLIGDSILLELRNRAMSIATLVAEDVDAELHETLVDPSQEDSSVYELTATPLRQAAEDYPYIDSIYTLRRTEDPNTLVFVLDSMETEDTDGDGLISADEEKAHLGEPYDVSDFPELVAGFDGPSADTEVTEDKWGEWISGYAPILNAQGEAVAVLGADIDAGYYRESLRDILSILVTLVISLAFVAGLLRFAYGSMKSR